LAPEVFERFATLSARHMIPMASGNRQITEVGGLMSYGANIADAYRQVGLYVGRILKGDKPADMPVVQSTTKITTFMGISGA
jgi:putative tryptophan/tyrosine transport system substrate-binding protein